MLSLISLSIKQLTEHRKNYITNMQGNSNVVFIIYVVQRNLFHFSNGKSNITCNVISLYHVQKIKLRPAKKSQALKRDF